MTPDDDRERTDRQEAELAEETTRSVVLSLIQAMHHSVSDRHLSPEALLRGFVDGDYRFTESELSELENIDESLRDTYERLVEGEEIDYDGPSIEEMLDDDE